MSEKWTYDKVNQLIINKTQENLNLEYKAAAAWKIKNTIKDEIMEHPMYAKRSDHFFNVKISETPPRYVPILPGLFQEWKIGLCDITEAMIPSENLSSVGKLKWKIHADNAIPIIGEIALNDIELKEPPHA